jgi:hypothetical protein
MTRRDSLLDSPCDHWRSGTGMYVFTLSIGIDSRNILTFSSVDLCTTLTIPAHTCEPIALTKKLVSYHTCNYTIVHWRT